MGGCLSVTLRIVDRWQLYVCCSRSGVIRCTLFIVLYQCRMCHGACDTRCCDRRSVHLCASSLQNLTVPQDFYFIVSISVERSWLPGIRWYGTGVFQEQGHFLFIGLAARSFWSPTVFPFSSFILWVGIVGLMSSD